MSRLTRHALACRSLWCVARIALVVANVVHLAVHGTPLDSGALDGAITQLEAALIPIAMTRD